MKQIINLGSGVGAHNGDGARTGGQKINDNFTELYVFSEVMGDEIANLEATKLAIANNLSDLDDAATARTNLGIGNIDNTSDVNKPVSTAQATADATVLSSANSYTDSKVASVYKLKGSVANYAALPSSGQVVGDVWNLVETGANYVWTGTVWDELGTTVDISVKANVNSQVFTGTPSLPTGTIGVTQTAGTNNTTLATTAFATTLVNNKLSTYNTYFVNSVTGNNTTGVFQDANKPFATIDYVLSLPAFKDGDIIFLVYVYNYLYPTVYPLNGQIPDKSVTIKSDGYVQLVFSANNNANLYLNLATVYVALTVDLPRGQIINERNGGSGVTTGITSGSNRNSITADYVYLNTSNPLFVNWNGGYIDIKIRSMAVRTTLLNGDGYVGPIIINEFNCLANNASIGIVGDQIVTISKITGVGSYSFRAGRFNIGDITTTGTCTTSGMSEKVLINFMNSTITSVGGFDFGLYYGGSATITGNVKSTPLLNLYGNEYGYITINFINFSANLGTGQLRHYGGPITIENCSIKSTNSPLAFWNASSGATITLKNSTFQVVNSVPLVTGGAGGTCVITMSNVAYNATAISDQVGTGVTVNVIGKQVVADGFDSKDAVNKGQLDAKRIQRLAQYTVATLPTGVQGDTAYVTDAIAPTYLGIVMGGGAVVCRVFYNGTNWIT